MQEVELTLLRQNLIHRTKTTPDRWMDTSFLRSDGRDEFRERSQFGNRHAVFEKGDEWGKIHHDKHNAIDFPFGTINHLAQYANEKTGIPEDIVKIVVVLGSLYVGHKIANYLGEDTV